MIMKKPNPQETKNTKQFETVKIGSLHEHPKSKELYGNDDVADLVESIKKYEMRQPLKATKGNVIIDGHRRWRAAKELVWDSVPVEYLDKFASDEEETTAILLYNQQRVKTNEQRVHEANEWLEIESAQAEKRQKSGQRLDLGDNSRKGKESGRAKDIVAKRAGIGTHKPFEDGRKAVNHIEALETANKLMAAKGLRKELNHSYFAGAKAAKKLVENPEETIKLLELIGAENAKNWNDAFGKKFMLDMAKIPKDLPTAAQRYKLHCGDILEVGEKISDELLSARNLTVMTDIPYVSTKYGNGNGDKWEEATRKVAEFADRYLPEKGSLILMTGHYWLDGIMRIFDEYPELSYYWIYCVYMPGQSRMSSQRHMSIQWKPMLHFVKRSATNGKGPRHKLISDVIKSEPLKWDERVDEWQQSSVPFAKLTECLTRPGDTICDPMMGSGTTGVVALQDNRKFIGIDIDKNRFKLAQKRLQETAKELDDRKRKTT
jgi:site-specific DNA-methyltransferase (adenine-specific)